MFTECLYGVIICIELIFSVKISMYLRTFFSDEF